MTETGARGVLSVQDIGELAAAGGITASEPIEAGQFQPASLDLRLGSGAFRVNASFLPGDGHTVADKLRRLTMHRIDTTNGAVLERGCVYIVPLMENLDLPGDVAGEANPKSTSGRLDVFTRLITDRAVEFDRVPAGYTGPLYAEISPCTFSILVRKGARLNQLRLHRGDYRLSQEELRALHIRTPLVDAAELPTGPASGLSLSVDLRGNADGLVGYRARPHAPLIDVDRINHYEVGRFWEPLHANAEDGLILNPGDFYILASREAVTIPPDHAAEMVPYDSLVGEFRVHYAGFFDPGFGWEGAGGSGSRAVLEVRSRDVPFLLDHGQTVARLIYQRLTRPPERVYGTDQRSNYQRQGLKLAKQFRQS